MKKILLLLVLAAGITISYAQEPEYENDDELQTLFTKSRPNGGYGAFTLGYTKIDGRDAIVTGGRGAFIFKRSLAIGLGGYGFINDLDYHYTHNNNQYDYNLAGGYGGIFIEPIIAPTRPVHVSFPVLFGIGGVALVEDHGWWDNEVFNELDSDVFLIVEPAVEMEFNLTKFFRAAVTASYRITSDVELYEMKPDVLNGLTVGLTFKLGKF